MTLDQMKIGQAGVIHAVGGEGPLRRRLLDMGLTPKTRVKVRKMAPMGDPIEIRLRGYELTLRKEDASRIQVAVDKAFHDHPRGTHGEYSHAQDRGSFFGRHGNHAHSGHPHGEGGPHHRGREGE